MGASSSQPTDKAALNSKNDNRCGNGSCAPEDASRLHIDSQGDTCRQDCDGMPLPHSLTTVTTACNDSVSALAKSSDGQTSSVLTPPMTCAAHVSDLVPKYDIKADRRRSALGIMSTASASSGGADTASTQRQRSVQFQPFAIVITEASDSAVSHAAASGEQERDQSDVASTTSYWEVDAARVRRGEARYVDLEALDTRKQQVAKSVEVFDDNIERDELLEQGCYLTTMPHPRFVGGQEIKSAVCADSLWMFI